MTTKSQYAQLADEREKELEPCSHCGRSAGTRWDREYVAKLRRLAESPHPICPRCDGSEVEPGTNGRGDCLMCAGEGLISPERAEYLEQERRARFALIAQSARECRQRRRA